MIELVNELNILSEESSLIAEFCSVISSKDKLCSIELSTKLGKYDNVIVLGNYFPKAGDTGVVLFAGKYKYPYFIPKFKQGTSPGSIDYSTDYDIEGSPKDFANFIDEIDKIPEYKVYFDIYAPREHLWGLPIFIQILFNVGKLFYEKFGRQIKLGDIARAVGGKYGPHKGVGHATGRGCDLNDILDNIDAVTNDTAYQNAADVLRVFQSAGIKAVVWDIQFSKYEKKFRQDFGQFIRTTDGSHRTHWHVSVIEPGQYQ